MTRNEILDKVMRGSKFYVNFMERSVRVDGKIVVKDGDFGEDNYEKEGDFSLEGTLSTIEELYNEYLHSIPSERSESHHKCYFRALKEEELSDEDMMYGESREVARARLETYVLEAICRGWLYWDEETMGTWFWQSKKHKTLIILREWVEGSHPIRDVNGNVLYIGCSVRYRDSECPDNYERLFKVYKLSEELVKCTDQYGELEALPCELELAKRED